MKLLSSLLLLALSPFAFADLVVEVASGERIRITRIDPDRQEIVIDGHLDEAVWQELPAYDEFVVIEPDLMTKPDLRTLIRFAYDDRGLYVAADMRQPPETLIRRLSGRDAREINRDSINLTLDTSGEGRYGFWFGINLGDALMDGTVLPERRFFNEWDGPWRGRSQSTDTGWTAEFFIPWSAVSMPSSGEVRTMGIYLSRKVAYLDQRWGWPPLPETVPKFMSALQPLEMERITPRQQYNVYPFVAASRDAIDDTTSYKLGVDVFWRPSSNFQLTATANPDFGNVESDEVIVNLTASETFFPEKRLFFLEGQEIFVASPRANTRGPGIGQQGPPYTMVNTRRIGGKPLLPQLPAGATVSKRERNQLVELLGAAQVSGQTGRVRYGVMGAFEDEVKIDAQLAGETFRIRQDGTNYGIGRLFFEDTVRGAYRAFGVLSTAAVHPDREAYVTGVDGHYLSANGKWKVDGQTITSDIEGRDRGYGGILDAEYVYRRGLVQRFGFEYFDEHFDMNDVGFLIRNNHMAARSSVQFTSPELKWARDNLLDARVFFQRNLTEDLFVRRWIGITDRITFRDLSRLQLTFNYATPSYDDLNSFGNGTYRVDNGVETKVRWDSDSTREFTWGIGGGFRHELLRGPAYLTEAGVAWQPDPRVKASLELKHEDRHGWLLHQGQDLFATFDAEQWQASLGLDYFITARQQLRVSLQWIGIKARERDFYRIPARPDDLIPIEKPTGPGARPSYDFSLSQYSFQARYRWEIAPLSDIFVVYTRQADLAAALQDNSFRDVFTNAWDEPLADFLVVKLRYRFGS